MGSVMDWHWTWQDPVALGIVTFVVGIALGNVLGRKRSASRPDTSGEGKSSRTRLTILDPPPDA
jgi:hypothetical protein